MTQKPKLHAFEVYTKYLLIDSKEGSVNIKIIMSRVNIIDDAYNENIKVLLSDDCTIYLN